MNGLFLPNIHKVNICLISYSFRSRFKGCKKDRACIRWFPSYIYASWSHCTVYIYIIMVQITSYKKLILQISHQPILTMTNHLTIMIFILIQLFHLHQLISLHLTILLQFIPILLHHLLYIIMIMLLLLILLKLL